MSWHADTCQGVWDISTGTFRLCKGLQQATATRGSNTSRLQSNTPSCALGSGTAPWLCEAQRPSLLWRHGQQAAHAWPARQRGRALYRALALPSPGCCPRLSRTRTQASVAFQRAAGLSSVQIRGPLSLQSCSGPAQEAILNTPICCYIPCVLNTASMSASLPAICLSLHLARSLVAVCARSKHVGLCCSWASFCLARQLWPLCHS